MKWWISDFDGTLTLKENNHNISLEDENFVKQWTKSNKFVIATGRGFLELDEIIKEKGFDVEYRITNNGAAMFKNSESIYELSIPMNERKQILENLKKLHKFCGIKISDTKNTNIISGIEEVIPRFKETLVLPHWFNVEDRFQDFMEEILQNEKLNNISLYAHVLDFDLITDLFKNVEGIKIVKTAPFVLEIMHEDVSKHLGIKYLQDKYKIDSNDIVVSGDGDNDFEMLKSFENSFVIKSATPLALSAGKTKISSVSEIGKYIK
ncbi:HAD-IIB family hydrolase [Spiroplasma endosymbiont of Cantharis rufa]|uniref:HAD-IIB family hydrolase n=1 Tax=Spiroplasma endosymbiont of Cantharis rufa TaxID=3066279 RepID=UPI0030D515BE